jgi:hypothetical protein
MNCKPENLPKLIADRMLDYGCDVIGDLETYINMYADIFGISRKESEKILHSGKDENTAIEIDKSVKLLKNESLLPKIPKDCVRVVHSFGLRCKSYKDLRSLANKILKEGIVPQSESQGKYSESPTSVFCIVDFAPGTEAAKRLYNPNFPWVTADIPLTEMPNKHYRPGEILTLNFIPLEFIIAMNGYTISGVSSKKLVKNPPSEGFTRKLGRGSFTQAWKNDKDKVELIIHTEQWNDGTMTDFSKEILIEARRIAAPPVKKLIPELKRKRVDTVDGSMDFIYSTKQYDVDFDAYSRHSSPEFDMIYESCENLGEYDNPFHYKTSDINRIKVFLDRILAGSSLAKIKNILSVFGIIKLIADSYQTKGLISRWNFDIRGCNLAVDKSGSLIFLDPLIAIGRAGKLLERFEE